MTRKKKPLSQAIEIAAASKAMLLHVKGIDPINATTEYDEFCGSSLFKAQIGISPMLLALSMELALKAWIAYEGLKRQTPKDHDLSRLFLSISLTTQERLKTRYTKEIIPRFPSYFDIDDGLERVLENARLAFVQWRYAHELERAHFDVGLFIETIEMILSEFESSVVVMKYP